MPILGFLLEAKIIKTRHKNAEGEYSHSGREAYFLGIFQNVPTYETIYDKENKKANLPWEECRIILN